MKSSVNDSVDWDQQSLGKRDRKRAINRRELIQAGRKLFSKMGLYDSRIEDITRSAGIAKGTIYLYFRDKEDLIQAVVSQGFDSLRRLIEGRIVGARNRREAAEIIVREHIEFFEQNPDLLRVFHQVRGMLKFNRPKRRSLRGVLRAHLDRLAQWLQTADSRDRLRPSSGRALACFLFGGVSGVCSVLVAAYPSVSERPDATGLAESLAAASTGLASRGTKRARGGRARPRRRTAKASLPSREGVP